jgi:6-pyruvoyltetrahydropterin/6-carboxytetrahydropterin synthase
MIVDLGLLERSMADARDALDHRFLDEINGLGPATMENLSRWIWDRLQPAVGKLHKVCVYRDSSGEACSYWGKRSPHETGEGCPGSLLRRAG